MAVIQVELPQNEWTLLVQNKKQFSARITSQNPRQHYYALVEPFADPPENGDMTTATLIVTTSRTFNFRNNIDVYVIAIDGPGSMEISDDATYFDVFVQDQTTSPVEYFLTQKLNDVVITLPAGAKTKFLTLEPGHGFIIGNHIEIYAETPIANGLFLRRFVQLKVVDVNINEIKVQPFIGFDLDPLNVLSSQRVTKSMNVDGSSVPVRFSIGPPNGLRWDLTRTMITMVCTTNPDDALYGNQPSLPNGLFFGFENDLGQEYLVNIQNNAAYRATAYDVTYTTRSSGGGDYGVSIRKSFAGKEHYGVAVRLEGPTNDEFVTYINDSLLLLTDHAQKIMGHNVN